MRNQGYLFETFSRMAVMDQVTELTDLYNAFIRSSDKEDQKFISGHFMLFLKCAESARKAPPEIKKKIVQK